MEERKIQGSEVRKKLIEMGVDYFTADMVLAYKKKKPGTWLAFEREALQQIADGKKLLRAKQIAEVIRGMEGVGSLENSMISYYARIFVIKYPEHFKLFRFEEIRGIRKLRAA